jgi:transposase
MRKGMATLAMLVQQTLGHDPFSGAIYAFRGPPVSDKLPPG